MVDKQVRCINLASYNYLGFGGVDDYCTPKVYQAILERGMSVGCTRTCVDGNFDLHRRLEKTIAKFLVATHSKNIENQYNRF